MAYVNIDTAAHLDGVAITHLTVVPSNSLNSVSSMHMDCLATILTGAVTDSFSVFNFEHAPLML